MIHRKSVLFATVLAAAQPVACGKKEPAPSKETDAQKAAPPTKAGPDARKPEAPPAVPEPDPLPPEVDLSGPSAPETSTVFFSVDGAMIPMACFDKPKKKLLSGARCLSLIADDATVLLASESGRALDTVKGKKNALCELSDRPTSLTTPGLDAGNTYTYAAFPKALGRSVLVVPSATESNRATQLDSSLSTRLLDAASGQSRTSLEGGRLRAAQRATLDLNDDGKKTEFISVIVSSTDDADKVLFSGLFALTGDGDATPQLLETAKGQDIVRVRGAVDLDGDGQRELWLGLTFDGGNADRIYTRDSKGNLTPLGKWTCGA